MQKRKWLFALLFATFAVKICLCFYFIHLAACELSNDTAAWRIVADRGDTFSYLGSIDNLIEQGEYYFWNGNRKVYAGRMPYYGTPYYLFRLFFEKNVSYIILIACQVFLCSLATVAFATLCFKISYSKLNFGIGYTLYFCSFNYLALGAALSPESFALSFFTLFLYFYHCFWHEKKWRDLFCSAVCLALLTSLKPYFVILYPVYLICILDKSEILKLENPLMILRRIAVGALPLLLLLAPWIVRNEIILNKFIPAQEDIWAGYDYPKSYLAFADFAGAWGSGSVPWDSREAGCYFLLNPPHGCTFTLPAYALADGFEVRDVEQVRRDFLNVQEDFSPEKDEQVAAEFKRLTEIYKSGNPWMYYVGSKLILAKKLFWHTNNYNLPVNPSFRCYHWTQSLLKVLQFGVYLLAMTCGLYGLLELFYQKRIGVLLLIVPVVITLFFVELRTTEHRYVNPVHQTLLIGIPSALLSFFNMLKLKYLTLKEKVFIFDS